MNQVLWSGRTEIDTKVSSDMENDTDKVKDSIWMVAPMSAHMKKTSHLGMESIPGMMENATMDSGRTVYFMGRE